MKNDNRLIEELICDTAYAARHENDRDQPYHKRVVTQRQNAEQALVDRFAALRSQIARDQALIEAVGRIYDALASNAAPFDPVYAIGATQEDVIVNPELLAALCTAYLPLK